MLNKLIDYYYVLRSGATQKIDSILCRTSI